MDDLFTEAVRHLLADRCPPQAVRAIEGGASAADLWRAVEEAGFADALVAEDQGGAGLCLSDVFGVFAACGASALPVPLAETMFARALLASAGVARPAGSIALAAGAGSVEGGLHCDSVRCGRVADHALVFADRVCLLLPTSSARRGDAAFALDAALDWTAEASAAAPRLRAPVELPVLQACLYAAQLAGALTHVFERTLRYANERQQFGRAIGKFQAIQHQLAVIAEHAFAARMAAEIGCTSTTALPDRLRAAVAKARTSEAALEVAALSHSIHGAIGFTAEFDLQLHTRRLHQWRQAGGSESYWHDVVGAELVGRHDGLALDLIRTVTDVRPATSQPDIPARTDPGTPS